VRMLGRVLGPEGAAGRRLEHGVGGEGGFPAISQDISFVSLFDLLHT